MWPADDTRVCTPNWRRCAEPTRSREGLWALRITALYRCARQADALAAYQELKAVLAEELGIDPSPRLRHLEAAVLAQDPMLAAPASPQRPSGPTPVPLPEPLGIVERAPLAGRDQELQAARAAWTAVSSDGGSSVLLVSGEAGIGKSRLVRELAREAHQRGVVVYGRCDEDLAIPYRPFVECLAHLVAHVSDAVLVDVEPDRLAELSRLVPALVDRRPGLPAPVASDSDIERYLLFGAVGSLLTAQARQSPVMVILDDLQWADRPTLQLLRHLAGLPLGRVLLVGVHRDPERPGGPLVEMLGELPGQATLTRIAPRGLTSSQAVALMAATAGRDPDEAGAVLAGVLHREADGNPFYLMEMFEHLLETGVITDLPDGRCTATVEGTEVGLPVSIRDVLRARLSRLGPETALVLSDAAVIGQEFDVDLLAGTVGLDEDHLLDLLEAAGRTALVVETPDQPGRFRFAHALVQHTLYRDIGAARRTRAHTRVAAAMEHLGGRQPGELASTSSPASHRPPPGLRSATRGPPGKGRWPRPHRMRPPAGTPPPSTHWPRPAMTPNTSELSWTSAWPSVRPVTRPTATPCSPPPTRPSGSAGMTCSQRRRWHPTGAGSPAWARSMGTRSPSWRPRWRSPTSSRRCGRDSWPFWPVSCAGTPTMPGASQRPTKPSPPRVAAATPRRCCSPSCGPAVH